MRKLIIASHHCLANGMMDTLQFLSAYPHVQALCAYVDDQNIDEQIKEVMAEEAEETFIFTDMLGGSVTQKFMPFMNEHVHLICGMNLPFVLSIALAGEEPLTQSAIEQTIQEAREALLYVNTYQILTQDDDE